MNPNLPNSENIPSRKIQIEQAKLIYKFDLNYLPPIVFNETLPPSENFDFDYNFEKTEEILRIGTNLAAVKARQLFDHFDNLDDYEDLYQTIAKPSSFPNYEYDLEFARQRVAGVNPMVLRKVKDKLPDNCKIQDSDIQKILGNKITIKDTIKEGKLFITDYSMLDGLQLGRYERGQKFLTAPIALFYWQSSGYNKEDGTTIGNLIPIAIQLRQKPEKDEPIFTPLDGLDWRVAKTFLQAADANHLETYSHLGRTHLVIEPIIVATHRTIANTHPLFALLIPHFKFNLAIDTIGKKQLINRGGYMDQLLAGTLEASLKLTGEAYSSYNFDKSMIKTELKDRGLLEKTDLPDYPYRHDGILIWNAIHKFVSSYIDLYYTTDEIVASDVELQNWVNEIRTMTKMKGFITENDKEIPLSKKSKLIDTITHIIFTATAQHSCVNFPQYDFIANVANMPFALYKDAPKSRGELKEISDLMKYLPPNKQTTQQVIIMFLLTAWRYNRLGHYSDTDFTDERVAPLIDSFQRELTSIEKTIDTRNKKRPVPYIYLKPSLILNSINI
ncbi:MAG: lipoxygenase family protein [Leptospiraceae bacterium]|nr:lipoxygenase family protein [Leptospiraceae bacterium]